MCSKPGGASGVRGIPALSPCGDRRLSQIDLNAKFSNAQSAEPDDLQGLIDERQESGFKELSAEDWMSLRKIAKHGLGK